MATLSTVLSRQWLRVSQRRTPLATAINRTHAALLALTGAPRFQCPICRCDIPFATFRGRQYAQCLSCGSLERHRLQWLVLAQLRREHDLPLVSSMSMLHVAPAEFVPQFRA